MKVTNVFHYEWKPSRAYHKISTFHDEQRWMGHKEGSWRMHFMYSDMEKGTSWLKRCQTVALAIVELCKSEGISQEVS